MTQVRYVERNAQRAGLVKKAEVRAVWVSSARTDPRGGRSAMSVPTAPFFFRVETRDGN